MRPVGEPGVLRLVVADPDHFRGAIAPLNLNMTETEVLVVEMANRPGALADICGRLAQEHINIGYAYCTTGASGGKTKGVFKVADARKAMKVLKGHEPKHKSTNHKLRRPMMTH